ncbi:MAG: ATP-binding protein [Planctomycetota bacterium]
MKIQRSFGRRLFVVALVMGLLPIAVAIVVLTSSQRVARKQARLSESLLPTVLAGQELTTATGEMRASIERLRGADGSADARAEADRVVRNAAAIRVLVSLDAQGGEGAESLASEERVGLHALRPRVAASGLLADSYAPAVVAAFEAGERFAKRSALAREAARLLAAAVERARVAMAVDVPAGDRFAIRHVESFAKDVRILLDRLQREERPEELRELLLSLLRAAALRLVEIDDRAVRRTLARRFLDLQSYTSQARRAETPDVFELRGLEIASVGQAEEIRGRLEAQLDALRRGADSAVARAREGVANAAVEALEAAENSWLLGLWTAIALVVLAGIFVWIYLHRQVVLRLEQLIGHMSSVAGGELGSTMVVDADAHGDELERLGHAIVVFRDRSRTLMERTQELEVSQENLRASNEDLRQFVYHASHDLRSPIRGIAGMARALREDGLDGPESTEFVEAIHSRALRLGRLIDDLLAYSRAVRATGKPADVSVAATVRDARELLGLSATVAITCAGPDTIRVSPVVFDTVIRNLLDNANKHHPDPDRASIAVEVERSGERLFVRVEDDGSGIPATHAERAFEVFTKLESRDEVEGSGMGLAIVRRMLRACSADIELVVGRGTGACFQMSFPVGREQAVDVRDDMPQTIDLFASDAEIELASQRPETRDPETRDPETQRPRRTRSM